jgi:hypothetical protein
MHGIKVLLCHGLITAGGGGLLWIVAGGEQAKHTGSGKTGFFHVDDCLFG